MKRAVSLFLTAFLLVSVMQAIAADDSLDTFFPGADKGERKTWKASAGMTTLAQSRIRDDSGNVTMRERRLGVRRSFKMPGEVFFFTGIGYNLLTISAPEAARLPKRLHGLSMMLGAGRKVTDETYVFLMAAPGLRSDFSAGAQTKGVRVPLSVIVRHKYSARLSFAGGVAYSAGFTGRRILPIAGVIFRPDEHWVYELGFPRTAIGYRIDRARVYATAQLSGGEYHTDSTTVGAERLRYSDRRLLAGVDYKFTPALGLNVGAGYAFKRRFSFPEKERADIKLDDAPFATASISYGW